MTEFNGERADAPDGEVRGVMEDSTERASVSPMPERNQLIEPVAVGMREGAPSGTR